MVATATATAVVATWFTTAANLCAHPLGSWWAYPRACRSLDSLLSCFPNPLQRPSAGRHWWWPYGSAQSTCPTGAIVCSWSPPPLHYHTSLWWWIDDCGQSNLWQWALFAGLLTDGRENWLQSSFQEDQIPKNFNWEPLAALLDVPNEIQSLLLNLQCRLQGCKVRVGGDKVAGVIPQLG